MFEFLSLESEAFGLDISDSSLKIAKLKKKDKFLDLAAFGESDIPEGIIKEGEIQNEAALVKIIKNTLSNLNGENLATNNIVTSLPEEKTFLEIIQMPKMTPEELKESIYLEAENHIPLSIEDVYLDFQVVTPLYNHLDHLDVLIVAVPKKTVDSYVSCFRKVPLQPKILEIESLSIARSLIKNISPYPLLLIDLGANKTSFIIFSGHSVKFTRSVTVSAKNITDDISKKLGVSFQEAESIKIKFGINQEYQLEAKKGVKMRAVSGRLLKIIDPLLSNLTSEIKKCIDYYQEHFSHEHLPPDSSNKGISKVLLCGGGANLKGLPELLSLSLKIPVELGNPWVNILGSPLRKIPEISYEKSLTFTTVLGLALRGVKK